MKIIKQQATQNQIDLSLISNTGCFNNPNVAQSRDYDIPNSK